MKSKKMAVLLLGLLMLPLWSMGQIKDSVPQVKKVLVMGDSMTGWLADRLGAYGKENGFEVSTIVWDGSTIKKWAQSPNLKKVIDKWNPDAVIVSLGMNESFETRPEANLGKSVDKIVSAIGDRPFVWIGPPTWPGKGDGKGDTMSNWLEKKLGSDKFFNSRKLTLPRQSKTNPHPTRTGCNVWMDNVVEWIGTQGTLRFPSMNAPASGSATSRSKNFLYRKMKEGL